jgi:hypothetical protein
MIDFIEHPLPLCDGNKIYCIYQIINTNLSPQKITNSEVYINLLNASTIVCYDGLGQNLYQNNTFSLLILNYVQEKHKT